MILDWKICCKTGCKENHTYLIGSYAGIALRYCEEHIYIGIGFVMNALKSIEFGINKKNLSLYARRKAIRNRIVLQKILNTWALLVKK